MKLSRGSAPRLPRLTGTITKTGPFFEHDPAATFAANVRSLMTALAIAGEIDAKARIASISPAGVRTGRSRRLIRGRVDSISGRHWRSTAVIGIPRVLAGPDPIATYAALAEIERLHRPMRQTSQALRGSRAINTAELVKGLT